MCSTHYYRWLKYGDPSVRRARWDGFDRRCEVAGCDRKHNARGFCTTHYRQAFPERAGNPVWDDRRRELHQARRAKKRGAATGEPVLLAQIRERDNDRCGLCGTKVSSKPWPHPKSASLDHIVPLSRGGKHDPANVHLAHLRCNISKGNRGGGEQLMLYG